MWANNKHETNAMISWLIMLIFDIIITLLVAILFLWYFCNEYFDIDTNEYIITHFIYDVFKIILQTQAVLVYDGYGNDVLANKPECIYLFSLILTSNCFFSGILWLFYSINNDEYSEEYIFGAHSDEQIILMDILKTVVIIHAFYLLYDINNL